jgi:hypothetical protein
MNKNEEILEEITDFPEQNTFNTDDMSIVYDEGED